MRPILDGAEHAEKKKKKLDKLIQKYYGKIDLLAAWHEHPNPDVEYIRDLKARLRTHKNDLLYRGHDDIRDQD
jgi:hypothetical protein